MELINCLGSVGGLTAAEIRALTNGEPAYVYERDKVLDRIADLRRTMPQGLNLAYSLKANPFPPLVNLLLNKLEGADVTSMNELVEALNTGTAPEKIMFAGPAKKEAELRAAVALGVGICIESLRELKVLPKIAEDLGKQARVLLRINPEFSLSGASMRMGGAPTQFGLNTHDLPDVWQGLNNDWLSFAGIHIYWGSQCLSEEAIEEAQATSVDLIIAIAEHFPRSPELLNLGGGFGIPYFAKDTPLDLDLVGQNFAPHYDRLHDRFPEAQIFLELGRYMVGEAGIYVCNVVDKKTSHGVDFIVTDGGMHQFLAASGNLGHKIRRNYPISLITSDPLSPKEASYQIVGALCTPIDLLGNRLNGPNIEVGDMLGVMCAGAYGKSASPLDFLSHDHPREFLL